MPCDTVMETVSTTSSWCHWVESIRHVPLTSPLCATNGVDCVGLGDPVGVCPGIEGATVLFALGVLGSGVLGSSTPSEGVADGAAS